MEDPEWRIRSYRQLQTTHMLNRFFLHLPVENPDESDDIIPEPDEQPSPRRMNPLKNILWLIKVPWNSLPATEDFRPGLLNMICIFQEGDVAEQGMTDGKFEL